jgi:hypothetical protein
VITHTNPKSIQAYRDRLGEELYKFLSGLWKLRDDVPKIDSEDFTMSVEDFKALFVPVIRFIAVSEHAFVATAQKLEEEIVPQLTGDDLKDTLFNPQALADIFAEKLEISAEDNADQWVTFNMALVASLSPFALQVARNTASDEKPVCDKGCCPVCKQDAEMGILTATDDESTGSPRKLWCSYCETEWAYDRIRCTRCGTRNQESLTYHYDDGDSGRRIYFCSECESTQKVLCEKSLDDSADIDVRIEAMLMSGLEHAVSEHCLQKKVAASN